MKFESNTGCVTSFLITACLSVAALALLGLGMPVEARVIRFDVQSTQPFAGGMSFGGAGSFEELVGVATLAVDPRAPQRGDSRPRCRTKGRPGPRRTQHTLSDHQAHRCVEGQWQNSLWRQQPRQRHRVLIFQLRCVWPIKS